jgi:hypothetical protein
VKINAHWSLELQCTVQSWLHVKGEEVYFMWSVRLLSDSHTHHKLNFHCVNEQINITDLYFMETGDLNVSNMLHV